MSVNENIPEKQRIVEKHGAVGEAQTGPEIDGPLLSLLGDDLHGGRVLL
jgi:hypothetical protein